MATVNTMKRELYGLIINELERQARPSMKGLDYFEKKKAFRKYVNERYLYIGRPLNLEFTPYFQLDDPDDEHEKMLDADIDVLMGIASQLGYVLELNWSRR
jgi:hypothetical protein